MRSKTFNYLILNPKMKPFKIENYAQVNGSSLQFLAVISNTQ